MKTYKNCQSCAMPMKKDPQQGGANADGTKNSMYCSYCYENGQFTQPDFTVKDMQQFCKTKDERNGIFWISGRAVYQRYS